MRKASINFAQVPNIVRALRHINRREKSEPTYLLPKEHRMEGFVVNGSQSFLETVEAFRKAKAKMTGQAKARGSSPFWEGIMVLPTYSGLRNEYAQNVASRMQLWKARYEAMTKHKVHYMAGHLDEGVMEGDEPRYNEHAHLLIDRLDADGRVIKLGRAQLSQVQDMTAEVMGMERGETLAQRGGHRGRKHMGHHEYRRYAAAERAASENYELGVDHGTEAVATDAREMAQKVADASDSRGVYLELRGLLRGSGKASQADYSTLKALYERRDERFERLGTYVQQDAPDVQAVLDYLRPALQNDYESPCL